MSKHKCPRCGAELPHIRKCRRRLAPLPDTPEMCLRGNTNIEVYIPPSPASEA